MSTRKKWIEDNDLKMNMSTIFILPMLGFPTEIMTEEFFGAYLDFYDNKHDIVLLFENTDSEGFKDLVWIMQQSDFFESMDYDDDNKELAMIFRVPDKYKDDFKLIMAGKYSAISKDYKEVLLDVHGRKAGQGKCIYMIDALYPDNQTKRYRAEKLGVSVNDLPNGEVMSIPSMENEQYLKVSKLVSRVGEAE